MGLFDSLFGSKKKDKSSFDNTSDTTASNNATTTSNPFAPALPFLLGNENFQGLLPGAASAFNQGGFNAAAQEGLGVYNDVLTDRVNDKIFREAADPAIGAIRGGFDALINPVDDIKARSVGMVNARAGQGVLDPTNSLSSLLSGEVVNPFLHQQKYAMINDLTRNLQTNVMPGIRSTAMNSGQFGGSRQGIAEGLAMSRMNQDLAPAITNLFGGAFENAQNRMMGTANALNDQAERVAVGNADRNMQADMFNANLGLQNNSQLMQNNQLNLGNRQQGLDQLDQFMGMQDNIFNQYMNATQIPSQMNFNNLNNLSGLLFPTAQLGGTTNTNATGTQSTHAFGKGTNTQTSSPGIVPAILGTMSTIAGMGMGGMGGGMGGIK
jgi:hypothetical protein